MRDLGYIEGQNVSIDWRWGRGTTERFAEFAADAVRRKVDVIVAANSPAGHAAQAVTKTIPIVIATMVDPVTDGFVDSFARPGRNITGLTLRDPELQGKRLQLFKEAVPTISRIAALVDETGYPQIRRTETNEAEAAAQALGIRLEPLVVIHGPEELESAFARTRRDSTQGILVVGGTMLFANRVQLADRALNSRVPMMCDVRDQVEAGCLMSYGPSLGDLFRRTAVYVDRILKGAKPADLPVERPTKFELVVNLKTARALRLTIPESLLQRADQVIE